MTVNAATLSFANRVAALNRLQLSPVKRALMAAGLSFLFATILVLVADVVRQLGDLTTSSTDNVQWTLSQAEVDFAQFRMALLTTTPGSPATAGTGPDAGLQLLRHRFDLFYSRVATLNNGQRYAPLRDDLAFSRHLRIVNIFLAQTALLMDGADAVLQAHLAKISDRAANLQGDVRDLSLRGVAVYAVDSDHRRIGVAATLFRLGLLTLALVVALGGTAVMLYRLVLHSQGLAQDQNRTNQRLETIVSTSLDAILVVDAQGIVLDFNGAAEQVFGYARTDAIGRDMTGLIFPPDSIAAHRQGMARYLATGEKRVIGRGRVQMQARRSDGSLFPMELSLAAAKSDDSQIFVAFLRDISERVAAEDDLRLARDVAQGSERAKAGFLAVMSHEMRTPLNGLLGSMELMRSTALDSRQTAFLASMETSGRLLLHHINDVLDISGLEAGKLSLDSAPFSLLDLLAEVIEGQRPLALTRGNRIDLVPLGPVPPLVCGDATRVRQVLLNLVGNAVKFTADGRITLEVEQIGDVGAPITEFRVIDTGIGIAETEIDRIFEDFVTLDGSYRRDAEGTGLGLGIARRLAEAMGGDIGVESVEGAGSLFWVRLPLPEPVQLAVNLPALVPRRNTGATAPKTPTGPLSVLLVEDNQVNRLIVREFLKAAGHQVVEAVDGIEGLAIAESRAFDVILMDISMPRMDGVQVTRRIRAGHSASSRTPILALTAHALPAEIDAFLQAGFDACLTKPISKARLMEAVAGLCTPEPPPAPPPAPPQTDNAGLIDQQQLETMIAALGADRANDLLCRFITEADAVVGTPPHADLQADIHRLAGSSGTIGAKALQQALARVETALKQGQPAEEALAELPPLWAQTRPLLQRTLPPAPLRQ